MTPTLPKAAAAAVVTAFSDDGMEFAPTGLRACVADAEAAMVGSRTLDKAA